MQEVAWGKTRVTCSVNGANQGIESTLTLLILIGLFSIVIFLPQTYRAGRANPVIKLKYASACFSHAIKTMLTTVRARD